MSRRFLPKLLVLLAALAAIAFWIITLVKPDLFNFQTSYVIAGLVAVVGLYFLIRAIQEKDTISKRANMLFCIPCLVGAVAIVVAATIGLEDKIALPILLGALVVGFILSLCVTGGKKWDEGDNHKVGYKNYYERKAEEEKNKNK